MRHPIWSPLAPAALGFGSSFQSSAPRKENLTARKLKAYLFPSAPGVIPRVKMIMAYGILGWYILGMYMYSICSLPTLSYISSQENITGNWELYTSWYIIQNNINFSRERCVAVYVLHFWMAASALWCLIIPLTEKWDKIELCPSGRLTTYMLFSTRCQYWEK